MSLRVIRPGMLTSVQDRGRHGLQKAGVPVSGAVDTHAMQLANMLVLNDPGAAGLEITMAGPVLLFEKNLWIAVTGADLSPVIDGRRVPMNRPVFVCGGAELRFDIPVRGLRTFLAIGGGIEVPSVLGSRSTSFQAGFGGIDGRALRTGDRIPCGRSMLPDVFRQAMQSDNETKFLAARWTVDTREIDHVYADPNMIRVLPGREWEAFTETARQTFLSAPFTVSAHSNRMGLRLEGCRLTTKKTLSLLSAPVSTGTIQIPGDGQPILLLHDRQTTGGYPIIAHVISADLPKVAQVGPGNKLTFQAITLEEAEQMLLDQEKRLRSLQISIRMKWHDLTTAIDGKSS